MNLSPLRGKLIAEFIPDVKRTASGLYIAETIKEVPHRGKVLAIGLPYIDRKGRKHSWDVAVGETVHFKRKWSEFKDTHYVLKREDIFAVERWDGSLRSTRDMVIVKRVYEGKIGNSSIEIPDGMGIQSNLEEFHGLVVAVGPEDKFGISVGDKILYHRNEGSEVKLPSGDVYFSIKPRAALAKI